MATPRNDGSRLSDEELREYEGYLAARVPVPDKFGNVVHDNTSGTGIVYRRQTAEEAERFENARKAHDEAVAERERMVERARKEASSRKQAEEPVPPRPDEKK